MRPKRGSIVKVKLKDGTVITGVVKQVGKKSSKKRNTCWIECEDRMTEINFDTDVEACTYNAKNNVSFMLEEESANVDGNDKLRKKENEMDAMGVFFLQRDYPIEVLATLVPAREYKHLDILEAMEAELQKWKDFEAWPRRHRW